MRKHSLNEWRPQQPDREVDMCMFVWYINIKMVFK